MPVTTKHIITIKPMDLDPNQVEDLLLSRKHHGQRPVSFPVAIESVKSGDEHEIVLALFVEEPKILATLADGKDNGREAFLEAKLESERDEARQTDLLVGKQHEEIEKLKARIDSWQKSISAVRDGCKSGFDAIGWPFPPDGVPVAMPEMVAELVNRLFILIQNIDHEDVCTAKDTGEPDENCSTCTDGDLHDILFPGAKDENQ